MNARPNRQNDSGGNPDAVIGDTLLESYPRGQATTIVGGLALLVAFDPTTHPWIAAAWLVICALPATIGWARHAGQ